ncbi:hypothetical protein CsatB_008399 [Cannabis sativa]|uniref:Uncharacterized protein n=1 Tax=Cannabis sativa TaxID=3483 RepID=A0A803NLX8_CANSA|nr:uncharacterized protein LOC115698313 [Cannabis sativa]
MGTARTRRPKAPSDQQNWQNIFNALVEMLQTQQIQLEWLAKERKILEDRIIMQQDRWVSDIRLLEDQISQARRDLLVHDMTGSLELAKAELVMGLKHRDAHIHKLRLEYTQTELEAFKVFKLKCSEPESGVRERNTKTLGNSKSEEHRYEKLESEVRSLKQEYDKLYLEKQSEVSALLAEKTFVWNQYNILETNLRSKNSEIEQADEKLKNLISGMEQLQSSNNCKDECIARLTSELNKMKKESSKLKAETGRLSQEVDLLRKSRSASITPVLTRCTSRTKTSNLWGKTSDTDSTDVSEKGSKRSKRKADDDVVPTSVTPKLFSATFKVPKLKNSHPLCD